MKTIILKRSHRQRDATVLSSHTALTGRRQADEGGHRSTLRKTWQRYCTMALVLAIIAAGVLMLLGYPTLGKGLILGTLFSVVNFFLMALVLPMRLGKGRGKSFFVSTVSIYLRYVLLALPLIWAFKQDAFAFSTAAIGLFMVQIAILGDHLFSQWRHPLGAD